MTETADSSQAEPPEGGEGVVEMPTNLWERVQRAKLIAGDRSRVPRRTWAWIARHRGVSIATAKRIYADYLSWDIEVADPLATVDEGIALFTVMLERLGFEAVEADQASARVGAVRAMNDVLRERFLMLQAAGRLPRNLARYRAEAEFTTIVDEILDVLERRGVERDALEDIQAIVRGHMEGAPGKVVELRPRKAEGA